jgi:membrane associated rhomboid family serine protease
MDVYQSPVSVCIAIVLTVVWIGDHYQRRTNPMHRYFNYENIVQRKQYWRAVSSACSHESLYHLTLSLVALLAYRYIKVLYIIDFFSLSFFKLISIIIIFTTAGS